MPARPPTGDFPKRGRLRRRAEFLKVQERGAKLSADSLTAMVLRRDEANSGAEARVGFTVSSKVGNAVIRNRVRRKLREVCRPKRRVWPKGIDVVFIARPSAKDATQAALERAVTRIEADLQRRFSNP